VQRDTSPLSAPLAFLTFMMLLVRITNWEPDGVTLAGYCYAMRQIVTVSCQSQSNCVAVCGNIMSVYPL
jgi:hypothetical protein